MGLKFLQCQPQNRVEASSLTSECSGVFGFISRPWLPQAFAICLMCLCTSCLVSSLITQALSSVLHVLVPFFNKKQVSGKIALIIQ